VTPSVSVIVATLDAAGTLAACIDSVSAQEAVSVELLVIDGGSTDGTVKILHANDASVAYWESEPDRGVYHAWNKALDRATGRWVCFLGADDKLAGPSTLKTLVEVGEQTDAELVCSRVRYQQREKGGDLVIGQPWSWRKLCSFMCLAHPGLLHRRDLFARYGKFSEDYRIAGDYEFLLRLGPSIRTAFVDEATVDVGGYGLSSDGPRVLNEMRLIQGRHPLVGPRRAKINYVKSLGERAIWTALDRLPIRLPDHPAVRAVGGVLGLHRHDYKTDAREMP
jgi:glycosyltransferase involved in cell wall biosynthesis